MIFSNLFNVRPYAKQLHELVIKSLFDEQIEVRIVSSITLSGFYQCGYIQVTQQDLVKYNYSLFLLIKQIFLFEDIFSSNE